MNIITIKKRDHYIFSGKEEFEQFFMDREGVVPELLHNWRDVTEIGQWVIADDGGIAQILFYKPYKKKLGKNIGYCRTACGTFVIDTKSYYKMDTSLDRSPENRYRFTPCRLSLHQKRKLQRYNRTLTQEELNFFIFILDGKHPYDAYKRAFKKCSSPVYIKNRVKKLLLSERMIKMFQDNEAVKDVAKKLGINHEYILKNYQILFKDEKSDNELKFKINTKMGDIIGTTAEAEPDDMGYLPPAKRKGLLGGGNGKNLDIEEIESEEIENVNDQSA